MQNKNNNNINPLPDNVHGSGIILLLIHTHHKHRGVSRGGRNDDLLGPSGDVGGGLIRGGEDASRLHHIVSSRLPPGDGRGVTAAGGNRKQN